MKDLIKVMFDCVCAMRGYIDEAEEDLTDVRRMIREANRLLPHFKKKLNNDELLELEEERSLRDTQEQISNFFLVDVHTPWTDFVKDSPSVWDECVSLFHEIDNTIEEYFSPRPEGGLSKPSEKPSKRSVEQRTLFDILSPMVEDREGFVNLIRSLIGDSKGKRAALVMFSALKEGCFLEKATFPILMNTFQDLEIKSKSGYNKYLNPSKPMITDLDTDPIKKAFENFLQKQEEGIN